MEKYPLVSIIVAVYNMENTIGKCIEKLLELDYPDKEIIMVDDGSTDNTKEIVSNYPVKYIREENRGVSQARNTGIKNSKGDIIAFTDGDCYVEKNWLKNLVKHFKGDVGGVGGYVKFLATDPLTSVISIEYEERFKKRGYNTRSIACINAAFKREAIEKIGGFQKILGEKVGGEDIDLSYRITGTGYRLVYEPKAVVYHDHTTMSTAFIKRNFRNSIVSVANYLNYRSAFEDRYFNWRLIIQPPMFATMTALGFSSLFYSQLRTIFLGILILTILWNLPLALKTCKRNGDFLSMPYLGAILFLRGFVLTLGMFVGILKFISIKTKRNLVSSKA